MLAATWIQYVVSSSHGLDKVLAPIRLTETMRKVQFLMEGIHIVCV